MSNDEKKARDEAATSWASTPEYRIHGDPLNDLLLNNREAGFRAGADWQAKRENSSDIRVNNVNPVTVGIAAFGRVSLTEDEIQILNDASDSVSQKLGNGDMSDSVNRIERLEIEATFTGEGNAGNPDYEFFVGDTKVSDSSAEFPEAEFNAWLLKLGDWVNERDAAVWAFERGRASREPDMNYWYDRGQKYLSQYNKLHAKLAEAQALAESQQAEIERLKGVCKDFNRAANSHFDQSVTNRKLYEESQAEIERLKAEQKRKKALPPWDSEP